MDIYHERITASYSAIDIISSYINGELDIPMDRNICILFDIDDTLIDSLTGQLIIPIYNVYRYAAQLDISIVLVTARNPEYVHETQEQLHRFGITSYASLYMVGNQLGKGLRKKQVRSLLHKEGYNILLNIGDDPTDFQDGGFIYGLKLPYQY